MKAEEIKKYVGASVALVIALQRRTSVAIFGDLNTDEDPLSGEQMFSVSDGCIVVRFPANDVHAIEVSENKGVVIRLTN